MPVYQDMILEAEELTESGLLNWQLQNNGKKKIMV
jgi:hypothetical protein